MRIVGGLLKGRVLKTLKGRDIRPTSDRARESVFNILSNGKPAVDMTGAVVLDVFAGTGALGLEALSRGARFAMFIDNNDASLALVKDNAVALGVIGQCQMLKLDAGRLGPSPRMHERPADVVFLDPPYGQGLAEPALLSLAQHGWLTPGAVLIVETEKSVSIGPLPGYGVLDVRNYGAALITFFRWQSGGV